MGLGSSRMITFASLALIGGVVVVFGFGVPFGAPLAIALLVAIPLLMIGPYGVSALRGMHAGSTPGRGPHGGLDRGNFTHGQVHGSDISATART